MRKTLELINTTMALEHNLIEGETEVPYSEIDEKLRNQEIFAERIPESQESIYPGVQLHSRTLELPEGHFSNVYDISFLKNSTNVETRVVTRQTPLYPHRLFKNDSKHKIIACINGAFFYLHDGDQERTPREIVYNLNIRDGKIINLPAANRPAILTSHTGEVSAKELSARGVINIGNQKIDWVGGEPFAHNTGEVVKTESEKPPVVLYNSACCTIAYEDPADKKSLRKLQEDLNHTPIAHDVTDIVVTAAPDGLLHVEKIQEGGGTDFFEGNFILQMPKDIASKISVGEKVDPETLDDLSLKEIESAVTTGPMVSHFLKNDDHNINHDPSLGTFPPFAKGARYARSVMYEDKNGFIHMVVFDAVPRSTYMKGVTPREAAENIPPDTSWAVFLDGGQSSRLTFRSNIEEDEIDFRGNQQYIRLHKKDKKSQTGSGDERYLWSRHGRELSSVIELLRTGN